MFLLTRFGFCTHLPASRWNASFIHGLPKRDNQSRGPTMDFEHFRMLRPTEFVKVRTTSPFYIITELITDGSTLRELEPFSGSLLAVLFPFFRTGITCHKPSLL